MMERQTMTPRFPAAALVLAALAALALPAAAQGLRAGPQLSIRPPADNQPRAADYIVAVVNSEPITNNEVRLRATRAERQIAAQGGTLPPREQLLSQVLERLIAEKAQVQGSALDGISQALGQKITLEDGRVVEANFGDNPLMRIDVAPPVEVAFVLTDNAPTGLGEPALPPVIPALCNAIFAATGKRVRTLPIDVSTLA